MPDSVLQPLRRCPCQLARFNACSIRIAHPWYQDRPWITSMLGGFLPSLCQREPLDLANHFPSLLEGACRPSHHPCLVRSSTPPNAACLFRASCMILVVCVVDLKGHAHRCCAPPKQLGRKGWIVPSMPTSHGSRRLPSKGNVCQCTMSGHRRAVLRHRPRMIQACRSRAF